MIFKLKLYLNEAEKTLSKLYICIWKNLNSTWYRNARDRKIRNITKKGSRENRSKEKRKNMCREVINNGKYVKQKYGIKKVVHLRDRN